MYGFLRNCVIVSQDSILKDFEEDCCIYEEVAKNVAFVCLFTGKIENKNEKYRVLHLSCINWYRHHF